MKHLRLHRRSRIPDGSGGWSETVETKTVEAGSLAVVIVDMWDNHWCRGALRRVNAMAPVMNRVVEAARNHGVQIIHAPAETMAYYAGTPYRRKMLDTPLLELPEAVVMTSPPLPFDDSDGGCDTEDPVYQAWSRQHPEIAITEGDGVTDQAEEIYSYIKLHGITTLVYMGVHPNMCVLNRYYGIKRFRMWGVDCLLARDLTDVLYNPKMPPYISHEKANEEIVAYIEKYWCPSIASEDLTNAY